MAKLIIGLGNPGEEYQNTRHNIGFEVVDFINEEGGGEFMFDKKFNSEVSEAKINGKKVVLAKPQTFMNKSGEAVKKLVKNLKFKISDLIVVHDDLDIPFGKTKLSFGRSSAGHKGIESIFRVLKTEKIYRVRIGTFNSKLAKIKKIKDKRKKLAEMNKFVVGPFTPEEKNKVTKIIKQAAEKAISILR